MAHIVTLKCLVDTTDEASSHNAINALMSRAARRSKEVVLDFRIGAIEAITPEMEDAIMNETYEHGDAFSIVLEPIAGGRHGDPH